MRTTALFLVWISLWIAPACQEAAPASSAQSSKLSPSQTFAEQVETAHQKSDFLEKKAIRFNLLLSFGGKERLNGTLTLLTHSGKGRIDYADGKRIIYDGSAVYYSPEVGTEEKAEFAAYTWSYFFLLPYKLSDPGTRWTEFSDKELQGKIHKVEKLSFTSGTGGSSDDWYILYADPKTNLLHAAAYIVTAGQSTAEAEKDPHAIEYLDYRTIEDIPVATRWNFWAWRQGKGFTKKLGEATLSQIRFTEVKEDFFTPGDSLLRTEQ